MTDYRPMIWTGAALGLRWSEVVALRVGRLDLDAGRLAVARPSSGGPVAAMSRPPESKAGKRTMFIPKDIVAMLSPHLEHAGFTDDATTFVVEGIDMKTAQTRLGHADPRTTLAVYASAPASIDRAAANVVGVRFFGKRPKGPQAQNLRATSAPIHSRGRALQNP